MNVLPPGKFPNHLLKGLLESIPTDESVIVAPGIGRDAAAVRIDEQILVLKSDPITFASDQIGWYLVNINANDIACMGAEPRWLLVTALLPEGKTTPKMVQEILDSVQRGCETVGCNLVGGHTEITEGLDRPILVGNMVGVAQETDLVDPTTAQAGDALLLVGGIATEGSAILANEIGHELASTIDPEAIERAASFLYDPGISVVSYARCVRQTAGGGLRALHDPTEGGLATGLGEVAEATGHGLQIDASAINIYAETSAICDALGLDPWGLIASGALLAVVEPGSVGPVVDALKHQDVPVSQIGTLTADPTERTMVRDGRVESIPAFEVDEIARFFANRPD